MCHLAACIVSGGVRRSAMISLFDYDDQEMLTCKNQKNIVGNEQRYFANNSAVWLERKTKTEVETFMNNMFSTHMGEPGIFSRYAANRNLNARRAEADFGTNPCGEIFLKPYQFCNLSSVVCRAGDTEATLETKVELATIIGTLQAMSDYFPGLRQEWRQNQIEERLLGVDLNGIMDCETIRNPYVQERLKDHAIKVNAAYSAKFGVNQSVAVTCIKPSGNSSVLLDTSPGIHTRWSKFYIRRIELHKDNPILQILQYYGVPTEKALYKRDTWIAEFPVKAPKGAKVNGMFSAVEQLETWKMFKTHWTEHNPSVTITYKESERQQIIDWVYENQDYIGGLSFLPGSDAHYDQMPYEAISEEKYTELAQNFPRSIDWNLLHILEDGLGDLTNASQVAACSGDKCLITY
jgi:ribonucleoside-triphosphate reductase